jgi:hypothetical protein
MKVLFKETIPEQHNIILEMSHREFIYLWDAVRTKVWNLKRVYEQVEKGQDRERATNLNIALEKYVDMKMELDKIRKEIQK